MAHQPITSTPGEYIKSPAAILGSSFMASSLLNETTTGGRNDLTSADNGGLGPVPPTAFGLPAAIPNANVKIDLENADLWRRFNEHTTEMIVTKTGRRMFPTLRYSVSGLEPGASYAVFLELCPVDDCRYKFQQGRWVVAGRADPPPTVNGPPAGGFMGGPGGNPRLYAHPDSPAPGRIWMRQPISFHRIKLTNNPSDPYGHVLLNSMHKYQPRLFVLRLNDFYPAVPQLVASAAFGETPFVAVTAYQNERVIQLKIDHNPFAKGFRENSSACSLSAGVKRQASRSPLLLTDTPQYKRRSLEIKDETSDTTSSSLTTPPTATRLSAFHAPTKSSSASPISSEQDRTRSESKTSGTPHTDLSSESLNSPTKNTPVSTTATVTAAALSILPPSFHQHPSHSSPLLPPIGPAGYMNPFLSAAFSPFSAYAAAAALQQQLQQQQMQQQLPWLQQSLWFNPLQSALLGGHSQMTAATAAAALFKQQQQQQQR